MKSEGHPSLNNVCFIDVATSKKFLTRSALKSPRKETIDGIEYHVVVRDVTSDSHPAYTGEKRLVDIAGRIEKFSNKFKRVRGAK
ncbi:MAG: type B 50S ribosomal protein L31 [Candidatus Synoicihabitans palmerolidicus]|nr:type B 50S ribosomal protein L31 [Candidatus Synoicihabitans palmerolidicus]